MRHTSLVAAMENITGNISREGEQLAASIHPFFSF